MVINIGNQSEKCCFSYVSKSLHSMCSVKQWPVNARYYFNEFFQCSAYIANEG